MGIAHVQNSGWTGVHGFTNDATIFDKIKDLKRVQLMEVIGASNGIPYTGVDHSTTEYKTIFYRIDNEYITAKCPPIAKIEDQ